MCYFLTILFVHRVRLNHLLSTMFWRRNEGVRIEEVGVNVIGVREVNHCGARTSKGTDQ